MNRFQYRFKRMLSYFGWTQKDIAAITGYSHIWIKKCSTQKELYPKLEHAVDYFEASTDSGKKAYNGLIPVRYATPPKGMKNFDLIIEAMKPAL